MKNTRTFWSVKFAVYGANGARTAWFENKEEAVKFASKDYCDNPIQHTVSKSKTIKEYNMLVELTRFELNRPH